MFTVKNHVYTVEYGGYSGDLSTLPESIINGLTKKAREGNIVGVTDTNTGAAYFYTIVDGELSEIGNSGSGGGDVEDVERKDLNFFDYDGTLLYSYTKEEAALLTALPSNPRHGGLVAQGWNWSLEDIHTQMEQVGACDAGQLYITDDGKTRLYCEFLGFKSPTIAFAVNGTCIIDWGDGTEPDTVHGDDYINAIYTLHEYALVGKYIITLESVDDSIISIIGSPDASPPHLFAPLYRDCCYKIELGRGIYLDLYSFYSFRGVKTITMPQDPDIGLGLNALYSCISLEFIVLGNLWDNEIFVNCNQLRGVSLPKDTPARSGAFANNTLLRNVVIPYTATYIDPEAFVNCVSLSKIIIPPQVNNIQEYAFEGCISLSDIYMLPTTPPTLININVFSGVSENCKIHVPAESLNAYQTATNWSSYAAYMVGDL